MKEQLSACIERGRPIVTELKPLVKKAAMFCPSEAKAKPRAKPKGEKPAKRQRKS